MSRYFLVFVALLVVVAVCTQGAEAQNKSGRCPRVPGGSGGICVEGCSGDRSCPGRQKCCSNGCGRVCKNPV
ncbi:hypothetical protein O3G_MSEX006396 [Manduca sexta]|uniref:WAP domain-containing protein n=1 Tax=Manduca sexta TaxID=7130 RepID=A0A921Z2P8_MANSE|nr:hypothetical protein O3G_MSEX006396 [Manduca sexta]KAG6450118.1 hypothetical protein O3G_MSEX006396 [Manduca sexta]